MCAHGGVCARVCVYLRVFVQSNVCSHAGPCVSVYVFLLVVQYVFAREIESE